MERILQLLASSSTKSKGNEEKTAALLLLNQLLPQIVAKYQDPSSNYDVQVAVGSVLSSVYDYISPSFILSLLISKKIPKLSQAAIEFLSYHTLAPDFYQRYLPYSTQLIDLFLQTASQQPEETKEMEESLIILIRHLILIGGEGVFVNSFRYLLSKQPSSLPPDNNTDSTTTTTANPTNATSLGQNHRLPHIMLLVDEIVSAYMINATDSTDIIYKLSPEEANVISSALISGLHGAAPESIRDKSFRHCKVMVSGAKIVSYDWLLSALPSQKQPQPFPNTPPTTTTAKSQTTPTFLTFLLSILMSELHLMEEEILCSFQELISDNSGDGSSSSEKDLERIQGRFYRCSDVYLVCLDILEGIISNVLPQLDVVEERLSFEELLRMKASLQKLVKEVLTFTVDSASTLATSCLKPDLLRREIVSVLRAVNSRSLHFLRLYRREDDEISDLILHERRKLLQSSVSLASTITPTMNEIFFQASSSSIDASFLMLFLCNDLLEEMNNHLEDEKEKQTLDQIIDIHSILLSFTLSYLKLFLQEQKNEEIEENDENHTSNVELLVQGLSTGLTLTQSIVVMKYSELKELLNVEGGDAFYNILGCMKEQIKELYEALKPLTKKKKLSRMEGDVQSLMKKVCERLEALALEDAWVEVLE